MCLCGVKPVSYTHLDVYKRQDLSREIQERLETAVRAGLSPESKEGKELCALHRRWLTIAGNRYDPAKHRGIAELYVMDERLSLIHI